MSKQELIAKIEELNQWEALMEEDKNEAEALRDAIKAEMLQQDTEEMIIGTYIVRWTSVLTNRFDTTGFKKVYIACGTTDLRRGIEGLAAIIRFQFQLDPYDKNTHLQIHESACSHF